MYIPGFGGRISEQYTKGLPVCDGKHKQDGTCEITLHSALKAHVPKHGFWHLFWMHALFEGQSLFNTHSGRQFS